MPLKTVKIVTNIILVVYATRAAVRCVAHFHVSVACVQANGEGGKEMGPSYGLCPTYHAGAAIVCSGTVEVGIA
jgi:hypothetical protein